MEDTVLRFFFFFFSLLNYGFAFPIKAFNFFSLKRGVGSKMAQQVKVCAVCA